MSELTYFDGKPIGGDLISAQTGQSSIPVPGALVPVISKKNAFGPLEESAVRLGFEQSPHSGIIATWKDGMPVMPGMTDARKRRLLIKSVMDFALASVGIVVASPLLLAIAAATKLSSPGPVIYSQVRDGQDGKVFRILKFRTLKINQCDDDGVEQIAKGDVRLTALGRLLRMHSLDELPQLFNVLRGEMSLVGPRPHVPNMQAMDVRYDELVPYYNQRLSMKPGITGWAQANGYRGPTKSVEVSIERIEHDIAYIQNFSLLLDLRTLFRTIKAEFLGSGAI